MMPNKGTSGIINRAQVKTKELINNEAWILKTAAKPERRRRSILVGSDERSVLR